jgi:hypothetical protein
MTALLACFAVRCLSGSDEAASQLLCGFAKCSVFRSFAKCFAKLFAKRIRNKQNILRNSCSLSLFRYLAKQQKLVPSETVVVPLWSVILYLSEINDNLPTETIFSWKKDFTIEKDD